MVIQQADALKMLRKRPFPMKQTKLNIDEDEVTTRRRSFEVFIVEQEDKLFELEFSRILSGEAVE